MRLKGCACASGAGTIIAAFATWKGAAFGTGLKTYSEVELSDRERKVHGSIEGMPEGDTFLIERCVELVLEHFELELGGTVKTSSNIPLAGGLKSSSAAANATILATLNAIEESMLPLDAVKLGVRAAREAKVTITGSFDDACASFFGGVVITDNRELKLLKREEYNSKVLIFAPDRKVFSSQTNVKRSQLIAPYVDMAYELALSGEYEKAMTLNGFLYCSALGFDTEFILRAMECGVKGVSLSGSGPAYVALVKEKQVEDLRLTWENCGVEGRIIETSINNRDAISLQNEGFT
jgi:shikimate kinase